MNCTSCHKNIPVGEGVPAFCPWCGEKITQTNEAEAEALLVVIRGEENSAKKHVLIEDALARYPENMDFIKERLYLGRMWERGGKPDFSRIPFWPLCALEHPEQFRPKDRKQLLEGFFHNPEVAAAAEKSGDGAAFYREYYERMAADYVDLFIKNANSNLYFLGFRRSARDTESRCAGCLSDMLKNLWASPDVTEEEKELLAAALPAGFVSVFGESAKEYVNIWNQIGTKVDKPKKK